MAQQIYASFILDRSAGLEIALEAENVTEATPITGTVTPLPAAVDFVEGVMRLRQDIIPLINMKKRLGLGSTQYNSDAKVAVVSLYHRKYGLLFDDIKDVFSFDPEDTLKMDNTLRSDDNIISSLINLEKTGRIVGFLNLGRLFKGHIPEPEKAETDVQTRDGEILKTCYSSYVIFGFGGQLYGCPVEYLQEIAFPEGVRQIGRFDTEGKHPPLNNAVKNLYTHVEIDGCLVLREKMISVLGARRLLSGSGMLNSEDPAGNGRVLILNHQDCCMGLMVDEVKTIERIPENEIMPMDTGGHEVVGGIYQNRKGDNIILLNMDNLLKDHINDLAALYRLSNKTGTAKSEQTATEASNTHHIVTENSYLIFSAGQIMAVQLQDVREIIEKTGLLILPGSGRGVCTGVIHLRTQVIPVINLKEFYGLDTAGTETSRLILCKSREKTVALEVDTIVTISKQDNYQKTMQLKGDMAHKKDTLDRLIMYEEPGKENKHILVINIHNLVRNYLERE